MSTQVPPKSDVTAKEAAPNPEAAALEPEAAALESEEVEIPPAIWDPDSILAFVRGDSTLQDVEGLSEEALMNAAAIGFSHLTNGRYKDAREVFMGLIALNPLHPYFHLALASIEQREKNFEAAEMRYSRVLELNPVLAEAYANRGEVRLALEKGVEGFFDLEKAVKLDPELESDATKRANVIMTTLKKGLEEAGEDLEEARAEYLAQDREWPSEEELQAREDADKAEWVDTPEAPVLSDAPPRARKGIQRNK